MLNFNRLKGVIMPEINAPPEVLLEREKTNRALAREGWGPTLRLKVLRSPVAAGVFGTFAGGVLLAVAQHFGIYWQ